VKRRLVFPVVGITKYFDGFGDCRDNCTREHFGIDITTYGWKGLPVVAAQDGTVTKITYDQGKAGCAIRIRGRDRWQTRYIHLNNDTPGTDDIGYPCPAPGIEVGAKVVAGQIIGWIGDSGNAEHGVPNIHFELRTPSGYPVDPYRSLKASRKIVFEWLPSDPAIATTALVQANERGTATVAVAVPSEEARKLAASETSASVFGTPVLVVDRQNPEATIAEIQRLEIDLLVIMSDSDARWIEDLVAPYVPIVEPGSFPESPSPPALMMPDAPTTVTERNPADGFPTIIAGAVDRIWRSYKPAYEQYIVEHRSVVLSNDTWARRNLGTRLRSRPERGADSSLLWWNTGNGWNGTETIDEAPDVGIAYLTERWATPWTLAFLGSLAEAPPMPLWR